MANTIRLKSGSGSNPSASDLVVGEVALRTDGNPKLFTKNDAGNVLEVGLVESGSIVAGSIVNADINASAAIAGTKISPNFGSQNVSSTGYFSFGTAGGTDNFSKSNFRIENTHPTLYLNDTNSNNDFYLRNADGVFNIHDVQANVNRFTLNSSGTAAFSGNLDVGAGLDVTGNITGTGDLTIDTNTLHVDSSNNRVGIGTTSPLYPLHVKGTVNTAAPGDYGVLMGLSTNNDYAQIQLNGDTGAFIDFSDHGVDQKGRIIYTHSNNKMAFFTNSGEKMAIDSSGNMTISGTVDGVDIATRDTLFGGLTSNSGVLTDGVTATTQAQSDNSTKVSTTAYVRTAVSNLVNSAPSTLDTLKELSDALGADANFSTTVTNSIATKMPLAGGTFSGDVTFNGGASAITLAADSDIRFTNSSNWTGDVNGKIQLFNNVLYISGGTGGIIFREAGTSRFQIDGGGHFVPASDSTYNIGSNSTRVANGYFDTLYGDGSNITGVNATTLDSLDSTSFLRSDANDNVGGVLTFVSGSGLDLATNNISAGMRIINNGKPSGDGMYIGYGNANSGATRVFGGGATSNGISVVGSGNNDVKIAGNTVFHAGNDGSGSGLDSDTVDGIQASSFLRSDADDTLTGDLTLNGRLIANEGSPPATGYNHFISDDGSATTIGTAATLRVANNGGNSAYSVFEAESGSGSIRLANDGQFYVTGNSNFSSRVRTDISSNVDGFMGEAYAGYFGLKHTDQNLNSEYMILSQNTHTFISATAGNSVYIRYGGNDSTNQLIVGSGNNALTWRGNKVFHAGNDGSGSGLDADTLDGQHGSYYTNAANLTGTLPALDGSNLTGLTVNNAQTLDNLDSTQFLRSDANDIATGLIQLTNGAQYPLDINGADNGKLLLRGSNNPYIRFREGNTDKAYIQWNANGWLQFSNEEDQSGIRIKDDIVFTQNNFGSSHKIWHEANDGSGSGLDSDTLDGVQGSSYLRSDAEDTTTAPLNITAGTANSTNDASLYITATNNNDWGLKINKYSSNANEYGARIQVGSGANYALQITGDGSEVFRVKGDGTVYAEGNNVVFHTGNDGSGSGLDADTLDGIQGASLLRSDADDNASNFIIFSGDKGIRLSHGNQSDTNDGVISSGRFGTGLNIVGTQTVSGTGRQVRIWGEVLTDGGNKFWNAGNDGSGSGLDADTLDGVNSGSFARSDASDTLSGDYTFTGGADAITITSSEIASNGSSNWAGNPGASKLKIQAHSDRWYIVSNSNSNRIVQFRQDGSDRTWIANDGQIYHGSGGTGDRYWRQGNDGSGSGLDADTLDGQEGSYYRNASNLNAGTIPAARIGSATVPSPTSGISIMGNFGQWQSHGTYSNFNTDVAYWGWNYIQGNTNAPNTGSTQWYRSRLSLGTGYGIGTASNNYWLEMTIPRYNHVSAGQMYIRSCENGSIGSWTEVGSRPRSHVIPYANDTIDLGSTTVRWRNIYTNDLNLSNEGSSNDVDGTWGSYTIQEGAEDLFLVNKRNGKKYKFNLTEVK